jgi:hypothetical protein
VNIVLFFGSFAEALVSRYFKPAEAAIRTPFGKKVHNHQHLEIHPPEQVHQAIVPPHTYPDKLSEQLLRKPRSFWAVIIITIFSLVPSYSGFGLAN